MWNKKWVFFFFFPLSLLAEWNEEFDQKTRVLIEALPCFQNEEYKQAVYFFRKIRNRMIHDESLMDRVSMSEDLDRFNLVNKRSSVICKKRNESNLKEVFTWEISFLLGSSEFFVPSFPVEIGEKRIIVQKIEPFTIGDRISWLHPKNLIRKVSLEDYWKAHITAYVLGLKDLVGGNIGINEQGKMRFFDVEESFLYDNQPVKIGEFWDVGFSLQSFDWAQYRKRITCKNVKEIERFIRHSNRFEEDFAVYRSHRSMEFPLEGLQERLAKIRSFPLKQGLSFQEFYSYTFPRVGLGLSELCERLGKKFQNTVGCGTALFYLAGKIPPKFSEIDRADMQDWIHQYVD